MTPQDRYALRELELLFGQSTPNLIMFKMMPATDHSQRLAQVEAAIDWIGQEHSKTRQHRFERVEDALTTDIITGLVAMGFDASHDQDIGGHSDIAIKARGNFLWLGEAKIHTGYDWLLKGFQQLPISLFFSPQDSTGPARKTRKKGRGPAVASTGRGGSRRRRRTRPSAGPRRGPTRAA